MFCGSGLESTVRESWLYVNLCRSGMDKCFPLYGPGLESTTSENWVTCNVFSSLWARFTEYYQREIGHRQSGFLTVSGLDNTTRENWVTGKVVSSLCQI